MFNKDGKQKKPLPSNQENKEVSSCVECIWAHLVGAELTLKTPSQWIQGTGCDEVETVPWNTSDIDVINSDLGLDGTL